MVGLPGFQAGGATQEFSQYAEDLFRRIRPETVVEIGPDNQLRLMDRLGDLCDRYICVALPKDYERMQLPFSVMGRPNLELVAGNAANLSRVVPHADVILKHNVLLDLTGEDAQLIQDVRTGRREASEAELEALGERFRQANIQSFAEFLRVASPGHILSFHHADRTEPMIEGLTRHFGIAREKIEVTPLLHDDDQARDVRWELVTIDNT